MLEDIIKTRVVKDYSVSILLYSIEKEDRFDEDNHNHFYEVRVSKTHDPSCCDWYTDSEYYIKRCAIQAFNQVCKELK